MSRFYASIQGSRGEATRQGTPNSGIIGHIQGWGSGVRVEGREGTLNKTGILNKKIDVFYVYATTGSTGSGPEVFLGKLIDGEWNPEHVYR